MPSLRPVSGSVRDIERLLRDFLGDDAGGRPAVRFTYAGDCFAAAPPLVVETSGSTGGAKRVALSAQALRASAIATLTRLGGPGQWVLALPAHYVAGLQVLTRSVLAGTEVVSLADHPDLPSAVGAMAADRRYLAAVPTQLHRWLGDDADTAALAALDAVLLGGAAARPELLGRARDRGVRAVTTYGMSETSGGCVYDGVALDGVAVALGSGGEIRLAGPVLFDEYVDQPELTAAVLSDGWLHTPDLGRFDDDGRLVVLGRTDDVVVSGGVNVALPAVEERLETMPGIADVAVTSRPDPEWGVSVVAVVVAGVSASGVAESGTASASVAGRGVAYGGAGKDGARSAATPSLDAIREFVAAAYPRSWAPRELVVVDAIPLLPSGKVDRRRLRGLLDSSDPATPTPSAGGRTQPGAARFVRPAPPVVLPARSDESGMVEGEAT